MGLPITLPNGYVSIYGIGTTTSNNGSVAPPGYLFGSIYNVWDGGTMFVYKSDPVMFKDSDVYCRLAIPPNEQYTIIKGNLVTKEILPP